MPKIPEKLSILLGVGDTLLARLHKIKVSCSDSQRKPSFLTDPQSVRLINNCTKKFQNGPDVCIFITFKRIFHLYLFIVTNFIFFYFFIFFFLS